MKDIFYQNNYKLILQGLFFFVGFSLPFSFAFNSISIALFFLFSFTFFKRENFSRIIKNKEIFIFYFLFFTVQLISVFYSNDKKLAFEVVLRNILFILLPIAFINLKYKTSYKELQISYIGLLLAVIVNLLWSYYYYFKYLFLENIPIKNLLRERFLENGIYNIHVPYFAMLIVFLIICTFKMRFFKYKRANKITTYGILFLLISSLFLISGLMSIFILFIFFGYLFLTSKLSKLKKVIFSITALLVIMSSLFYIKNLSQLDRVRSSESLIYRVQDFMNSKDSVRKQNWESVIKVISSNLIIGVGADGGLELLQKERTILTEPFVNKHNAHNTFLEILLRYGIIGISIYLLIFYNLAKKAKSTDNYFLKWFIIIFIISGITESYLQRQIGLVFFVFFSLLLYIYEEEIKPI